MTGNGIDILQTFDALSLVRKLPVNVSERDKPLFSKILETTIHSIKVLRITNSSVTSQGVALKNLSIYPNLTLANDDGELVRYKKRDIIKVAFFWPRVKLQNKSYLLIHNIYSDTYYHWLLEVLPRLFLIRSQIPTSILLLPASHNKKFHEESLKIFGVDKKESIEDNIRYVTSQIFTSTQIGRIANYHPEILKDTASYIKSRIIISLNLGDKIYISRRQALRRRIVNERNVESCLNTLGFITVNFEDYSFEEQINIMHHCKYLISIHGAGLANMIFMQSGGKVMELRKYDQGENYFYFTLASAVGHAYYYQFCDCAGDQNVTVQGADIVIDLEQLKTNVQSMLL